MVLTSLWATLPAANGHLTVRSDSNPDANVDLRSPHSAHHLGHGATLLGDA
jgi:hypothetical protein